MPNQIVVNEISIIVPQPYPVGKGIFIWQGKNFAGGSISTTVAACAAMKLKWVALKIGDRNSNTYASYIDMLNAVAAFHQAGIQVWGWHYIYGGIYIDSTGNAVPYGASPTQEAQYAIGETVRLGLDGYIIDAEKQFKLYHQQERATEFMNALDAGITVPVALCSYRFPDVHPEFPWDEFLANGRVTIHMPQVYWGPGNSKTDLLSSMYQLNAIKELPVVPVGRAYIGDGNANPTPEEITLFMQTAVDEQLHGCTFWAMDFLALHAGGSLRQKAITDFVWPDDGSLPPVVVPPPHLPKAIGTAVVTAGTLNVRLGPDTTYKVMGTFSTGVEVYVFEKQGDWCRVGENIWIKSGANLSTYKPY